MKMSGVIIKNIDGNGGKNKLFLGAVFISENKR
jgi:hypothetical protein